MKIKNGEKLITVCCVSVIAIYFILILHINFSGNPAFYVTDMYSDMNYAIEVWNQKTIFPDNWVFGNQLYVISTPTIAAIMYGMFQDPLIAMGIASTLMGVFAILSFNWMLKPLFSKINPILIADIAFLSIALCCGGPIHGLSGWQLFFTMCSYYSCYAINAFLAFGCYLRSESIFKPRYIPVFLLTCLMSFAMGIQSLRQTVVMVLPLATVEFFMIVGSKLNKRKKSLHSLIVCLAISLLNIGGLAVSKLIKVNQVEIFGGIKIINVTDFIGSVRNALVNIVKIFHNYNFVTTFIFLFTVLFVFIVVVIKYRKNLSPEAIKCAVLFTSSIAFIFLIDVFTRMAVREIYYFMIFPFIAIVFGFMSLTLTKKIVKYLSFVLFSVLLIVNIYINIDSTVFAYNNYSNVSEYLISNNITTVYSQWNIGDKLAIATDWKIRAGFWDSPEEPFERVDYLCDPGIFNEDPEYCAYIFKGSDEVTMAKQVAQRYNCELKLMKYFEEYDLYIYSADKQMMLLIGDYKN